MERVVEQVVFPEKFPRMQNVAAYARVSSGKDAMLHSLSAQVSYYSRMIQQPPGWKYCGVYADEAITGTKDSREQFQKLLERCRNGEIDLIINSPVGKDSVNDDSYLRKAAIKTKTPYMTTIAAAKATAEGIAYLKSHKTSEIKSLQELHSEIKNK